jgi:peptidoglycan/xylan/chitin deacetylase (PgdA/CDA1 family)
VTASLIYHDVAAPQQREQAGFPGPLAAPYKLSPEQFEAHLDALAATGIDVGLLAPGAAAPGVALTFDDGGASSLEIAAGLEARGWRGHFFVVSERVGTPGFLDADGVRELVARGHAVGSHTATHPMGMRRLDAAALAREWRDSRAALAGVLGAPPALAAVPGGSLSRAVIATAADAGYGLLLTSEPSTRVRRHGAMELRGRYAVWAATPPETVAAYARGDRGPRARLWLSWNAKTLAKRISPGGYDALRRACARA